MKSTHFILSAAALLTLVAAKPAQAGHAQAYDDSYCREYTRSITIGGRIEDSYGRACLQQDGSWKIVFGQDGQHQPTPRPYHDDRFDDDDWNRQPVVYYNNPRSVIYVSDRPDVIVVRDRHDRPKCHKHRHGHHGRGRGHDRHGDDDVRWRYERHWD